MCRTGSIFRTQIPNYDYPEIEDPEEHHQAMFEADRQRMWGPTDLRLYAVPEGYPGPPGWTHRGRVRPDEDSFRLYDIYVLESEGDEENDHTPAPSRPRRQRRRRVPPLNDSAGDLDPEMPDPDKVILPIMPCPKPPPQQSPKPKPEEPSDAYWRSRAYRDAEFERRRAYVDGFFEGVLFGDFSESDNAGVLAGQVAGGFVPYFGQVADVRDLIAAGDDLYQGKDGAALSAAIAVIAFIPGMDVLKGGKLFRHVPVNQTDEVLGAAGAAARYDNARRAFNRVRDDYARRLGVSAGGQVHHAIELQVLKRYPGAFNEELLNGFENMRGIATELAGRRQLHNSKVRELWNRHYRLLDRQIADQGLVPGTRAYNDYVQRYIGTARDEIDYLLGQFFSEYRSGLPRSFD